MKTASTIIGAIAVVALGIFAYYMIDIDQTQEARMPDVDISVEPGQMPKYDAEVGSIEVVEEDMTVEVPEVEVTMEEETVTVPTLKVNPPSDDS